LHVKAACSTKDQQVAFTAAAVTYLHFTINNDIDLDTLLLLAFQDLIEAPFLIIVRRSAHEQFGR
jgi:hypothetical protein